jgi:hypothetical protein
MLCPRESASAFLSLSSRPERPGFFWRTVFRAPVYPEPRRVRVAEGPRQDRSVASIDEIHPVISSRRLLALRCEGWRASFSRCHPTGVGRLFPAFGVRAPVYPDPRGARVVEGPRLVTASPRSMRLNARRPTTEILLAPPWFPLVSPPRSSARHPSTPPPSHP